MLPEASLQHQRNSSEADMDSMYTGKVESTEDAPSVHPSALLWPHQGVLALGRACCRLGNGGMGSACRQITEHLNCRAHDLFHLECIVKGYIVKHDVVPPFVCGYRSPGGASSRHPLVCTLVGRSSVWHALFWGMPCVLCGPQACAGATYLPELRGRRAMPDIPASHAM